MQNVPKQPLVKIVSGAMLLCMLALSIAACGTANDGKVHLTLWYWNRSISDKLLAQVNQHFPNIVLNAIKINDYDNKARTAMAGHHGVPDIMGINSNISTYFPDEDQFVDLKSLGADDVKTEYLPWKWNLGITPSGKMIGFPMDTGPTALFYRSDIFQQAGLPTDPEQVSQQLKSWDDYLQAGLKIKQATNGKSFLADTNSTIYTQMLAQSPKQYFTTSGEYLGDQPFVKTAWDTATKANQLGVSAKIALWTDEWNKAVSSGLVASFVGAVWMKQILQEAAPNTSGKWSVARAPGGDGNNGGSFLAITKDCEHPKEAFEVIKWLQSPQNQVAGYKDYQLFPSAISALSDPSVHEQEAFYGGQDTSKVFVDSAQNVPIFYLGPNQDIVNNDVLNQLGLVEQAGKNPEQGWIDAQSSAQRDLLH